MSFNEIKIEEFIKNQKIYEDIYFSFFCDPLNLKYQEFYHKTKFINKSMFLNNDSPIFIPMSIDHYKKYSFFGNPIKIILENDVKKLDYIKIQDFFKKIKSEKFFIFEIEDEKNLIESKSSLINKIFYDINIDLSQGVERIKKNFSSNTRNEIKKNYPHTNYEIIDKNNYKKDDIFEMMNLHIKISGKKTRSEETWRQNEKMIMSDKGFLIKVTYKNETVSYSFFSYNDFICSYFSSVADRKYYNYIKNVHHKSLWTAINFATKKSKVFNVGKVTMFNKNYMSDKERNIEKFKKKFKGINTKFVLLNDFPDYNFFKKFIII